MWLTHASMSEKCRKRMEKAKEESEEALDAMESARKRQETLW